MAMQIFDRTQLSQLLDLSPATVRNWSDGKPLTIPPSVRAPKKRGVQPLYSIDDLYVYSLAYTWILDGLTFEAVNRIIPQINRSWFSADQRGHLLIAKLRETEPVVKHFPKPWSDRKRDEGIIRELLLNEDGHVYKLGLLLDRIDKRVRMTARGGGGQ